ncbi:hypothetical protein ACJRO7_013942 [Eucalyptus globulus]|uniref:Late embryogenesis abundant protein LEA-2 subgroup domain-containing protein n=1 Tax=Eucalyptus globulus TaxID=34317 RepID=A0ABD3KYH4_EUCGL
MDVENSRANSAVVLAHSNQEYPISIPAAAAVTAGQPPQPPPSPVCEKYIYPCFKFSIITVTVFVCTLFLVIPALVIPDFRVEPASSSGSFNVSTSAISVHCDIQIRVGNPSSYFRVNYTRVRATLKYGGKRLSGALLDPLVVGKKKQATVAAVFESKVSNCRNSWQAVTLNSSVSRGEVSVDVELEVGRRIGLGEWWISAFDVTISCRDMIFTSPSSEGQDWALITPSELCDIGFFGYI